MLEFRADPIPHVRIGIIGLGRRGIITIKRYADVAGATIVCIADNDETKIEGAALALAETKQPKARAYSGDGAWHKVCSSTDIDLVYICTDWATHTEMACEAMMQGKHVAVEVPAATTVSECWQLVRTAERTRRHCFMTENCCYDKFTLATFEMNRDGQFGDITHCEGAYLHELHDELKDEWRRKSFGRHNGNPYPTHGLGPIGWLIGLHRGDRMEYLVSLTPESKDSDNLKGKVNNTLIHTAGGRSILLQFDVTTPRPYSRLQTICGTKGYAQKYPLPTFFLETGERKLFAEQAMQLADDYCKQSIAAQNWEEGHRRGVENEMNYAMDSRLIYCLRHGLPLDIDVYDAAEWSCIAELSHLSATQGSCRIDIPDFTDGRWNVLREHRFFT